jgi:hypothetical protein
MALAAGGSPQVARALTRLKISGEESWIDER